MTEMLEGDVFLHEKIKSLEEKNNLEILNLQNVFIISKVREHSILWKNNKERSKASRGKRTAAFYQILNDLNSTFPNHKLNCKLSSQIKSLSKFSTLSLVNMIAYQILKDLNSPFSNHNLNCK